MAPVGSEAWNERYRAGAVAEGETANRFVTDILDGVEPGTALDLGAGAGRNAVWLAEQGWSVRAVDFSAVAIERAKRLAASRGVRIETVVADATTYDTIDRWDLVLLSYLQLPTDERNAVLAKATQWLAPGGRLVIVAHDVTNVADGYGGPKSADVCYSSEATTAVLMPAGLTVDRAETVRRAVTDTEGAVALDTVVVAHRPPPV